MGTITSTSVGVAPLRHLPLFLVVLVVCLILSGATTHAGPFFAEDFNGPGLGPNLVDIDGTYVVSGGTIGNSAPQRAYVRTVESDYLSIDFQADLIYTIAGSGGSPGVFFGIGPATKDTGFFNEPEAALYLLDHTNGFVFHPLSNIVVRRNSPGSANITDLFNMPFPDGTAYARITKIGDSMTFAFDHNYNGSSFVPDGSFTVSLSTVAPFLDDMPSYLFFGTGFDSVSPSRFDFFQVTPVPEPATISLLGTGTLILAGYGWRRRSRGADRGISAGPGG
ncbi:MAG TPA: PEP-CTERM sorting domain-containing protein [Planctomycetaceae bacterium]|nr:PEP-CTERM sorting domain-containing protein [Planctomycetaceae bacterium]